VLVATKECGLESKSYELEPKPQFLPYKLDILATLLVLTMHLVVHTLILNPLMP
jgi:hypothetical protein